jgi:hypothetical protein
MGSIFIHRSEAPVALLRRTEEGHGRFFCAHTREGAGGGPTRVASCGLMGAGPAGGTAAAAAQRGAWGMPRASHPLGASDRILAGRCVPGPSQAWRVADGQGSRRPCHPPRAARAAPGRMACPGEHEGCDGHHGDGNHDDARVITRT